jgi:DNA-binding NarL/FixJ family response regulator
VLPLDADADAVLAATQAAAAGLVTVARELAADLLTAGAADLRAAEVGAGEVGAAPADGAAALAPLTPREREVLALLAQGLANKQVAARLGITEHTVKAHVAAIYAKRRAGNRAEAVVAAARRGLLLL